MGGDLVEVEEAVGALVVSIFFGVLSSLFYPEVQVESQHRFLLLVEMLVVSDLVVLHLVQLVERRLAQWPLYFRHKLILILHDLQ